MAQQAASRLPTGLGRRPWPRLVVVGLVAVACVHAQRPAIGTSATGQDYLRLPTVSASIAGAANLGIQSKDLVKQLGSTITVFSGLGGLAITSTAASAPSGVWQFRSANASSAWQAIPPVQATSALLLEPAWKLRFQPHAGAASAGAIRVELTATVWDITATPSEAVGGDLYDTVGGASAGLAFSSASIAIEALITTPFYGQGLVPLASEKTLSQSSGGSTIPSVVALPFSANELSAAYFFHEAGTSYRTLYLAEQASNVPQESGSTTGREYVFHDSELTLGGVVAHLERRTPETDKLMLSLWKSRSLSSAPILVGNIWSPEQVGQVSVTSTLAGEVAIYFPYGSRIRQTVYAADGTRRDDLPLYIDADGTIYDRYIRAVRRPNGEILLAIGKYTGTAASLLRLVRIDPTTFAPIPNFNSQTQAAFLHTYRSLRFTEAINTLKSGESHNFYRKQFDVAFLEGGELVFCFLSNGGKPSCQIYDAALEFIEEFGVLTELPAANVVRTVAVIALSGGGFGVGFDLTETADTSTDSDVGMEIFAGPSSQATSSIVYVGEAEAYRVGPLFVANHAGGFTAAYLVGASEGARQVAVRSFAAATSAAGGTDCAAASDANCLSIRRTPCSAGTIANTCGECLSGYESSVGTPSNVPCAPATGSPAPSATAPDCTAVEGTSTCETLNRVDCRFGTLDNTCGGCAQGYENPSDPGPSNFESCTRVGGGSGGLSAGGPPPVPEGQTLLASNFTRNLGMPENSMVAAEIHSQQGSISFGLDGPVHLFRRDTDSSLAVDTELSVMGLDMAAAVQQILLRLEALEA